jgi:hypothetical protein
VNIKNLTPSVYVPSLISETEFHTHTEPRTYYVLKNTYIFIIFSQLLSEWSTELLRARVLLRV